MKNKKVIFFDLDGTVLDVSNRIYQLYRDILKKYNKIPLSFKKYWKLKRTKSSFHDILNRTNAGDILSQFEYEWHKYVESSQYLKLDKVSPKIKQFLLELKKDYPLVLVTLRDNKKELYKQLEKKKILKIFDKVFVSSGRSKNQKWRIKMALIKKYGNFSKDSIIIGDTETDILAGKKLGIKTIGVYNGMRNKALLQKVNPDLLIKHVTNLKTAIRDLYHENVEQ